MGLSMTGLDMMHRMMHVLDNNPDDTLTLALTHKEFLNIVLGLYATDIFFPCLEEEDGAGNEFQQKLLEIAQVQKPDWVLSREDMREMDLDDPDFNQDSFDFDPFDEEDE